MLHSADIHLWNNVAHDTAFLDFELAYYAKYLIVAGYLASYNDPRHDVEFFSTRTLTKTKKKGGRKFTPLKVLRTCLLHVCSPNSQYLLFLCVSCVEQEEKNLRLMGPRDFPVDRMLAIFYAIIDESTFENVSMQEIYLQVKKKKKKKKESPQGQYDTVGSKNIFWSVNRFFFFFWHKLNRYLHWCRSIFSRALLAREA